MTIISNILLQRQSKCALVPFITAGYPDLKSTIDALYALDKSGADIIELGIPYADALADGPIIQESSRIALNKGVHIDQVINILELVIPNLNTPIVLFTYYNPILTKGIEKFLYTSAKSGVKGLIIPDLPLEETDYLIDLCNKYKIELILFIAPTSSKIRINAILSKSPGCIYLVSSNGVTGIRSKINIQINALAKEIKNKTNKAVILGFGISNAIQVSQISKWNIDGIVIGSAFIKTMLNKKPGDAIKSLGNFCKEIRDAIDQ
uniref:Tryptophan synthase alpha chain n=2 Tax=Kappaphycus TaxID=38543 RepID=A0A2H4FS69_9FLOR|nr:tryptophan synthase alpha subunit [Kappaphycus striatus]